MSEWSDVYSVMNQFDLLRLIFEPFASIRGGQYCITKVISQLQRCRDIIFNSVTFSCILCGYPTAFYTVLYVLLYFCTVYFNLIHIFGRRPDLDLHVDSLFRIGHDEMILSSQSSHRERKLACVP